MSFGIVGTADLHERWVARCDKCKKCSPPIVLARVDKQKADYAAMARKTNLRALKDAAKSMGMKHRKGWKHLCPECNVRVSPNKQLDLLDKGDPGPQASS